VVGGDFSNCFLAAFVDASHADEAADSRSTSGGLLAIIGPNTFIPLTATCKKQTAVSHSSTEAEFISLESFLREQAIPMLSLWDIVMELYGNPVAPSTLPPGKHTSPGEGRPSQDAPVDTTKPLRSLRLIVLEGNEAVKKILQNGRTLAFRHVSKTHRVNLDWVYEVVKHDDILVKYIRTDCQPGDMYTKSFSQKKRQLWKHLITVSSYATELQPSPDPALSAIKRRRCLTCRLAPSSPPLSPPPPMSELLLGFRETKILFASVKGDAATKVAMANTSIAGSRLEIDNVLIEMGQWCPRNRGRLETAASSNDIVAQIKQFEHATLTEHTHGHS